MKDRKMTTWEGRKKMEAGRKREREREKDDVVNRDVERKRGMKGGR